MVPIKDKLECKKFPIATAALVLLNCAVWAIQLTLGEHEAQWFMATFGEAPARIVHAFLSPSLVAMVMNVISIFTAMFLHGSWMHLIGNMVMLQAVGRSVENRFGPVRFLVCYCLAGCAANAFYIALEPQFSISVGASGALAGVMGMYLYLFPRARFVAWVPPIYIVTVRAYLVLVVWFATQCLPGFLDLLKAVPAVGTYLLLIPGVEFLLKVFPFLSKLPENAVGDHVNYWVHIIGFVSGFIIAVAWSILFRGGAEGSVSTEICDCQKSKPKEKRSFSLRALLGRLQQRFSVRALIGRLQQHMSVLATPEK
jgi:membrane associated rhomboid family serine protease